MNKWKNDFKMPLMLVGIKQMRINILIYFKYYIYSFFACKPLNIKVICLFSFS